MSIINYCRHISTLVNIYYIYPIINQNILYGCYSNYFLFNELKLFNPFSVPVFNLSLRGAKQRGNPWLAANDALTG